MMERTVAKIILGLYMVIICGGFAYAISLQKHPQPFAWWPPGFHN